MKYYSNKPINKRTNDVVEVVGVIQEDPTLGEVLAQFGYTENQLNDGLQRAEAATVATVALDTQLGAQVAATAAFNEALREFRLRFNADRRIARLLLREQPVLYEELRLHLKMRRGREDVLNQARHFYQEVTANAEVMALLLSEFNVTPDVFAARQVQLASVLTLMQAQQFEIGKMRVATKKRRDAMNALDDWMAQFSSIARTAFKNDARQLRKLGLLVKGKF